MPAEKFRVLPEVTARIDFGDFNAALMAAAIFHETNRVRQQMNLRVFRHLARLDEAADLQASVGAATAGVSHHNPRPALGTADERVASVGLEARFVAENIALSPALETAAEAGSQTRVEAGRRVVVDGATGREIRPVSYQAFAERVVRQWMDSPGHRANLVNPALLCLGCSARWRRTAEGIDLIYAVQVFFTSRRERGPSVPDSSLAVAPRGAPVSGPH